MTGPETARFGQGACQGKPERKGKEVQVAAIMTRFWGQEKQINVITHRLINVALLTVGL